MPVPASAAMVSPLETPPLTPSSRNSSPTIPTEDSKDGKFFGGGDGKEMTVLDDPLWMLDDPVQNETETSKTKV